MGNLFTTGVGNLLTRLVGNFLTAILGKFLDIYTEICSSFSRTQKGGSGYFGEEDDENMERSFMILPF